MKPQVEFSDYKQVFEDRKIEQIDQTGCDGQVSIIKAAVKREWLCGHLSPNYQHEVNLSYVTVYSLSNWQLPLLAFCVLWLDAEPIGSRWKFIQPSVRVVRGHAMTHL
jgi:hypothetical protein